MVNDQRGRNRDIWTLGGGTRWQQTSIGGYPFLVTALSLSIAMEFLLSPLTNSSTVLVKLLAKLSSNRILVLTTSRKSISTSVFCVEVWIFVFQILVLNVRSFIIKLECFHRLSIRCDFIFCFQVCYSLIHTHILTCRRPHLQKRNGFVFFVPLNSLFRFIAISIIRNVLFEKVFSCINGFWPAGMINVFGSSSLQKKWQFHEAICF